ncbi:MAG TPA: PfkB family carbohydrate kinase [Chthoniobacterales bacterium]|nr:PfkB family carbohydrate kinase [Chthoniobacterales bacterium]
MNVRRLREILANAKTKRILVIGDLMLDEFVWGKVGRISPEAPVPVVEVTGESFYPGGAANVARNLREFIDDVSVVGLIGSDRGGRQLRELLAEQKIDTADAIEDADFRTIVKTRIIARNQQIVRVDREQVRSPTPAQVSHIVDNVRRRLAQIDAIIFEDYGKGLLSAELVGQICDESLRAGKIVSGDPNPRHPLEWKNITAVKPNRNEAFLAAGVPWSDPIDPAGQDQALLKVGHALLEKWDTKYLLITLGEQGMMLFEKGNQPHHIPTKARQVFDVSGAGDTAIALFTLALCAGAAPSEAAEIANHGSAVVVGKLGTATVTSEELLASFHNDSLV